MWRSAERRAQPKVWLRVGQGAFLALGAPLGWLFLRLATGASLGTELAAEALLYAYLLFPTMIVFALFGFVLGRREDRLERLRHRLEHLTITDPLTKLRNRRYFHGRLSEDLAATERTGQDLSLVLLDIDHFKRINDRLGHQVGDRILAALGEAASRDARAGETVARIGGEEFAVVLPGTSQDLARAAAERVRAAVSEAVAASALLPQSWNFSLSAGVASVVQLGQRDSEQLFAAADGALYQAKAQGRDRVIMFEASRSDDPGRHQGAPSPVRG